MNLNIGVGRQTVKQAERVGWVINQQTDGRWVGLVYRPPHWCWLLPDGGALVPWHPEVQMAAQEDVEMALARYLLQREAE